MRGDNLLIVLEQEKIPHFIVRSHIYASFDDTEYRSEYHIYHMTSERIGQWNKPCESYDRLKYRKLSRKELAYFHENIHKYNQESKGRRGQVIDPKDGKIWTNKKVGFNPSLITRKATRNETQLYTTRNLFSEGY